MPQKKKKYNARFPPGRIKKIMQTDEDVGKVASAVPIMISRTLELFVENLLTKTMEITTERQARTLSPSHMKQCIMSESRFDFLRELVREVPNINWSEDYPSQGEGSDPPTPLSATPTAIVPALPMPPNGDHHNHHHRSPASHTHSPMDRPRRNYQRPVSYDTYGDHPHHHHNQDDPGDDSPTGILKRKLLDPSRKSVSADGVPRNYSIGGGGGGGGGAKLVRLDSSPAAFSDSSSSSSRRSGGGPSTRSSSAGQAPSSRRRKSNEATKLQGISEGPSITTSNTPVNLSANTLSAASVQILPDEHSSGCKVNVDFSNLISGALFNGSGAASKLLLSTAAKSAALATPNLTTPTGLNFAPPFPALTSPSVTAFPANPLTTTASTLKMDEDYDDL